MEVQLSEIQYFCTHDGPGIRTTVFFQGCPLACSWCHNPECSVLAHQCLDASAPIPGFRMAVEQVAEAVFLDLPFYGETGGITCSGGEPLVQAAALSALLELCREEGITTAVETSLHAPWDDISALLPLVDYWIVDIKSVDPILHRTYTGTDNSLILSNLKKLTDAAPVIWARMPIVPGIQAAREVEAFASLLVGKPAVKKVELIPFHLLGAEKYAKLGVLCPYPSNREPTKGDMSLLTGLLRVRGLPA